MSMTLMAYARNNCVSSPACQALLRALVEEALQQIEATDCQVACPPAPALTPAWPADQQTHETPVSGTVHAESRSHLIGSGISCRGGLLCLLGPNIPDVALPVQGSYSHLVSAGFRYDGVTCAPGASQGGRRSV